MLIAVVVMSYSPFQFSWLENCPQIAIEKVPSFLKEALMILLTPGWNRGMEKTRLVSWQGKPESCNPFILQPWRCHLLFAPILHRSEPQLPMSHYGYSGSKPKSSFDGNQVKTEANSEKERSSLEGGCPLWLAYDFSFNQTNNPLK